MSVMQQSIPDYLVHISSHDSNIPSTCTSSDNHCLATNLDAHVNDSYSRFSLKEVEIDLAICCQNDGSEDDSLDILQKIQQSHHRQENKWLCKHPHNATNINTKHLHNHDTNVWGFFCKKFLCCSLLWRGNIVPALYNFITIFFYVYPLRYLGFYFDTCIP